MQEAIEKYLKENHIEPFSEDAIEGLYAAAYGFYESGVYQKAIHFFRFLCTIDAKTRKHWMGLASSHLMLKQYQEAVECFAFASLLDNNDPFVHYHAAECFAGLGNDEKKEEALSSAEKVARKDPKRYETLLSRMALMREKTQRG